MCFLFVCFPFLLFFPSSFFHLPFSCFPFFLIFCFPFFLFFCFSFLLFFFFLVFFSRPSRRPELKKSLRSSYSKKGRFSHVNFLICGPRWTGERRLGMAHFIVSFHVFQFSLFLFLFWCAQNLIFLGLNCLTISCNIF